MPQPFGSLIACSLGAVLASFCAAPGMAQSVAAAGNGQSQTLDCGGGEAVLRGNDNAIAVRGACRSLLLEGNGNRVEADLAARAQVTVRGNGNRLRWRAEGGGEPAVSVAGHDNEVAAGGGGQARGGPSQAAPALALREEGARRTVECGGRDVQVEGNGNDYTLRGACRSLTLRGEGDSIRVEMAPGGRILVEGNGNSIVYTLAGPGSVAVQIRGEGSRVVPADRAAAAAVLPGASPPVRPAAPAAMPGPPQAAAASGVAAAPNPASSPAPAPSPAPVPAASAPRPDPARRDQRPIDLNGDEEARDIDCAGRDVRIGASRALIVLRGGCRSVTVRGDDTRVQAELAAGGRVDVAGSHSSVAYAILGGGDASASAAGQGSRVVRIPQLGAAMPQDGGAKHDGQ